jgi:type I restriction enzyme S subunit
LLRDVEVNWPAREEQRRIASILGALDDKIEVNRRMNETLEAMARAIFQDWFVAFGPTRAKMEGRPPYLAPDLWSLFPARLDAQGKPEGWQAGTLLDLCELKRGYDLPAARRVPGAVPIVSSSGITDHHDTAMVDAPGVITGRYGTIGEVFFLEKPYWPLNTALYVRDFRGHSPRFVFYTLRLLDFSQYSDKGAVPGVNRNDLHRAPVMLPPVAVQEAFDRILSPGWARIAANDRECASLAATRDLLLPRLMSGELRVRDAERLVETAA